jgi:DNA-binding transcriptional ArsR family regulator
MKQNVPNNPDIQILATFSKSIGHPARLLILQAIAEKGGWVDGEIVSIDLLAPTTVIQHLRELKRVGLIKGRIFGAQCSYGIDSEVLSSFILVWNKIILTLPASTLR